LSRGSATRERAFSARPFGRGLRGGRGGWRFDLVKEISKFFKIQPSQAGLRPNFSKKNALIVLDLHGGNERFQWVALTPSGLFLFLRFRRPDVAPTLYKRTPMVARANEGLSPALKKCSIGFCFAEENVRKTGDLGEAGRLGRGGSANSGAGLGWPG
jgi:hypothetical protein